MGGGTCDSPLYWQPFLSTACLLQTLQPAAMQLLGTVLRNNSLSHNLCQRKQNQWREKSPLPQADSITSAEKSQIFSMCKGRNRDTSDKVAFKQASTGGSGNDKAAAAYFELQNESNQTEDSLR